jgi:carbonic anhydrase
MSVLDQVLQANARYAANFGSKSELALPPARRFAILTCMESRRKSGRLVEVSGARAAGRAHA